MKPKLSIIIPLRQTKAVHRDVHRLDDCLCSLENQTARGQFEIIVSDTDSDAYYKGRHTKICQAHKGVKYIHARTGKPWNIGRARNIGIRAATGEYIMVGDMDCIFSPNFIETVLKYAADDTIIHCRLSNLPENYSGALDDWLGMTAAAELCPAWCYGACQVVNRAWAESVHGYDEKFELWGAEDTDFMERAKLSGKRLVWIESEASSYHQWHSQENRKSDPEQLIKNRARLKLTETKRLPIIRNPHEWGGKPEPDEWDDTAVIITTFLRDASLLRTIQTIRKFYPTIDIIIADNGHPSPEKTEFADTYDCKLIAVPFDSGVTAARNAGVKALEPQHKYVVTCEDDIGFMAETDLGKWRAILDHEPTVGVAGGRLQLVTNYAGSSTYQSYEAMLEINRDDRTAYMRRVEKPIWKTHRNIRYHFVDVVLNIFMARREVLDAHPWDEKIKSAPEHCDWFFGLKYKTPRLKASGVVFVPDVTLIHFKDIANILDETYRAYRSRPGAFQYFGEKWDIDYLWNSWHPTWGMPNPQLLRTYAETSTKTRQNVFASAARLLDLMGVKWWLEAGTCLGAIREKNFIGHDPDIDIGIWADDVKCVTDDLIKRMASADFSLVHKLEHEGQLFELSFLKAEVKIDVFFFFERNGLAWHGAFGPVKKNGTGGYSVFLPHVFSLALFRDLKEINFVGLKVNVPNPPEQYLTERYGPDWQIPNKLYRFWTDCRAVTRKFFEPEKAMVYIGGVWDIFHHGHLNILERCKALGARLVVGVLTDDAAAAYKAKPLIPEAERLRIIQALRIVDEAIPQHHQDPTEDLKSAGIEPDYLVHGDDWDQCPGGAYVYEHGGKVVFLPYTPGISSTDIRKWVTENPEHIDETIAQNVGGPVVNPELVVPALGENAIAIGIKTFMRDAALFKTLETYQATFANSDFPYRFYVADDGPQNDQKALIYEKLRADGHVVISLAFDSGISVGRNAILKQVKENYILISDDDVVIRDAESISHMKAVLDSDEQIGLVAATLKYEKGAFYGGEAYAKGLRFEMRGKLLVRIAAPRAVRETGDGIKYVLADQVPNIFLAKRKLFYDVTWDNRIKIEYEHIDFFLELKKTPWKAAICLDAEAFHLITDPPPEYNRYRRTTPVAYFLQKHGFGASVNQF